MYLNWLHSKTSVLGQYYAGILVLVVRRKMLVPCDRVMYLIKKQLLSAPGNIEYWEAVEPTLFPRSLFPLVRFVIMSLSSKPAKRPPSHSPLHHDSPLAPLRDDPSSLDVSELARQVVWNCMVEDPRLFLRSLLNQFNKLVMDTKCKSSQIDMLLVSSLHFLCVCVCSCLARIFTKGVLDHSIY